ncbi:MAG: PD40 domain-containing protein [Candidatus Kerfeldbacteria bacterium]|nr:PD40 domain-containing protein [Candidatus Kerfeldbacteria bacterium]
MNRRLLFITLFILIVIVFGALIYFVFLRDIFTSGNGNDNANQNTNQVTNGGVLPNSNGAVNIPPTNVTNTNRFTNTAPAANTNTGPSPVAQGGETIADIVARANALGVNTTPDGNGIRFYDKDTGQFFMLDALGKQVALSDQIFPQADTIEWSPVENKALITFPDDTKIIYDFDLHNQLTIPRTWNDVEFSPNGQKLGFKNESDIEDERWLAISNSDGSQVEAIEPLGDQSQNVDINWSPSSQVVATFREAQNGTSQEIFLIGTQGENFKSITTTGRGFEGTWSPDGKQLLYSTYNASSRYNPELFLVDASGDTTGGNTIELGLQTWSSKCSFTHSESFVYCAVPKFLPEGTGIVPSAATNTNDLIYKIDTNSGLRTLVALPTLSTGNKEYTVVNLVVSNDDNRLYFTDANTGNVYTIQLP